MIRWLVLGCCLCLLVGCTAAQESEIQTAAGPLLAVDDADLVILAGTLIDGTGTPAKEDMVIVIRDGLINQVEAIDSVRVADGIPVLDATGYTVLPGLFNVHVHCTGMDASPWPRAGVTTLVDVGNPPAVIAEYRRMYAEMPVAPRLLIAGPIVTPVGGYPLNKHYLRITRSLQVRDPEDAASKVQHLIETYEVDVIKMAITNAWWQVPRMQPDVIQSVVDTAHAFDRRVFAHVDDLTDFRLALTAGVDVLAHVPGMFIPNHLLRRAIKQGMIINPTLAARTRYPSFAMGNTRRFHALGGVIALGDDFPLLPEFLPEREMLLMSLAGMSNLDIIVAGTRNAAMAVGMEDRLGTLRPGMIADIIITGGNPLDDLLALRDIKYTLRNGQLVHGPATGSP